MGKSVELDPQKYSEEWFNVAVLLGKEFELPNISNPPIIEKTNMAIPKKQPFCDNQVPKYTFDLNVAFEPTDDDDQTDVFTANFMPCKKAKLEPNHESNSVRRREFLIDLNKAAPECELEDGEYRCFICNISYPNGHALGGHMSNHAKQSKRKAINCGNSFKPGSFPGFGESNNFFSEVIEVADEKKSTPSDSKEV